MSHSNNSDLKSLILAKKRPPRQKQPYSLTKFGCQTCKLRKIRCDEGLPICINCTKANRHCVRAQDGSSSTGRRRRVAEAPFTFKAPLTLSHFGPRPSLASITAGLEARDVTYLDAFRYRLVDGIVGDAARPAFKALLLQAICQEPAICHAAVAFGAVVGLVNGREEEEEQSVTTPAVPRPDKTLALRHYDKCIRGVRHLITQGNDGGGGGSGGDCLVNSTLLCALLCACFELRANKPAIALRHLEHGMTIMEANSAKVDDDLILAFSKLDVQATMFLTQRTLHTDMNRLATLKLANAPWYVQADKTLTSLLGRAFNFFRTKTDPLRFARDDETPVSLYTELQDLEDELRRFREEYALSGVPNALHSVAVLPHAQQILWLNSLMLHILLSCCLCMDEMVYDFFLADFEAIITMVEGIVYGADAAATSRTLFPPTGGFREFHLNMSLLFPIFKTAMLCRSPSLRRRCMALMLAVSFDEGVWQGDSGYKYAEILIRLEEEGLGLDDLTSGTVEDLGPEVIAEEQRLRSLDVQPEGAERNSTLFFKFNKETAQWDDLVKAMVW